MNFFKIMSCNICLVFLIVAGCSKRAANVNSKLNITKAVNESTVIILARITSKQIAVKLPLNKGEKMYYANFYVDKVLYGNCQVKDLKLNFKVSNDLDILPSKNERLVVFIKRKQRAYGTTIKIIKIISSSKVNLSKLNKSIKAKATKNRVSNGSDLAC